MDKIVAWSVVAGSLALLALSGCASVPHRMPEPEPLACMYPKPGQTLACAPVVMLRP